MTKLKMGRPLKKDSRREKGMSVNKKKKRGQSLFQSFKPVIKCDNLNSNPKRKFGREW